MISVRERIIRDVVSRCQFAVAPVFGVAPIPVLRQPTTAIPREQTPALIVTVVSDAPVKRVNAFMEREIVLRVTAYARDAIDGYLVADDLLCRAHLALFADASLGELVLSMTEAEADYQAEDADVEAIAIPTMYRITYRTFVSDISQGG